MKIEYQIFCDESYYIEGSKRYRSSLKKVFRYSIIALKILGVALLSFGVFISTHNQNYLMLAVCGISIGFILLSSKVDCFILKRNVRKSPHYGDSLVLSFTEDDVYMKSKMVDMKLSWSAFTEARSVSDGWLLFQGPKIYNWLSNKNISDENQLLDFKKLLKKKGISK